MDTIDPYRNFKKLVFENMICPISIDDIGTSVIGNTERS